LWQEDAERLSQKQLLFYLLYAIESRSDQTRQGAEVSSLTNKHYIKDINLTDTQERSGFLGNGPLTFFQLQKDRAKREKIREKNIFRKKRKTCPKCGQRRCNIDGIFGFWHCQRCGTYFDKYKDIIKEGSIPIPLLKRYEQRRFD
jgi:ribosomal protein L37AE/L43A